MQTMPRPAVNKFLDEIVFFVVESGAAQVGDRDGLHQTLAIFGFDESALAAFPDAVGDHLHRFIEIEILPLL